MSTSRPEIIQFRIKDDVRRRQDNQKQDQVVQFNFDLQTDNAETVVKDMVSDHSYSSLIRTPVCLPEVE